MITNTGYRQMLRDRCPKVVVLALLYCKAMNAWLDHAYKSWIWIYSSNEERLKATRKLLGYKSNGSREFKFADTIDWENLSSSERKKWQEVLKKVSWFQLNYMYVEDAYNFSKQKGKDIKTIKYELMCNWMRDMCPTTTDDEATRIKKNKEVNAFVDYVIDCIENNK